MTDPTLIPVAVACPCPGAPHDGDTVYLRPELGLTGGIIAQRKFVDLMGGNADDVFASLIETYVTHGVDSATFTDEQGDQLTREAAIALILSKFSLGQIVANQADDLYSNDLLDPLVARVSKSLPTSQTSASTSRSRRSSPKRRKPSKSSSTPTSLTEDIAAA
jgi:hypothetical protein